MHADGEVFFEFIAYILPPISGRDDFDHQLRCDLEITRFSGLCQTLRGHEGYVRGAYPVWFTLYEYANLANQYLAQLDVVGQTDLASY